jgi:hypothetical protein
MCTSPALAANGLSQELLHREYQGTDERLAYACTMGALSSLCP